MKKPELLSPAGNMESLIAAIEGGCDAIYLSGILYGARSYANNFNNEQLEEAVKYAHLYGVKIYVTINTLVYESEIKNFLIYVEFLQSINVDAVIIQDIGMMDLIHQKYPKLEIHASTQMHIHNLEGVKLLEELGIKRVVLARETPISIINEIKNNTSIELEIFIHGALCMCYSGQCLMSSLIGGRSGNRGTCAQPCRQPYNLVVDEKVINVDKYLLSPKDLNTLNNLEDLLKIGVSSLKIEGRMKRPEYVYLVTKIYREAIDLYYSNKKIEISENKLEELYKIFNRKFTKGFIFGETSSNFVNSFRPNHQGIVIGNIQKSYNDHFYLKLLNRLNINDGIRILMDEEDIGLIVKNMYKNGEKVTTSLKGDIVKIPFNKRIKENSLVLLTTDNKQLNDIANEISLCKRKVKIKMKAYLYVDEPIKLYVSDGINEIELKSEYLIEKSKTMPLSKNKIEEQLSKTGDTIYYLEDLEVYMDCEIFIPIKIINDLRRKILDLLNSKRMYKIDSIQCEYMREVKDYRQERKKSINVESLEKYKEIKELDYDEIYLEMNLYNNIEDDRKVLKIPRVIEKHSDYKGKLLIGELGSTKYNNNVSDFSFNVVNSYSVAFLHSIGVERITLSYELNYFQIKKIIENYIKRYKKRPNLEVIVSGKIEAMVMKYNLFEHYKIKSTDAKIIDKYNNEYSLKRKNGITYLYHYKETSLNNPEKYYNLGINYLRY